MKHRFLYLEVWISIFRARPSLQTLSMSPSDDADRTIWEFFMCNYKSVFRNPGYAYSQRTHQEFGHQNFGSNCYVTKLFTANFFIEGEISCYWSVQLTWNLLVLKPVGVLICSALELFLIYKEKIDLTDVYLACLL